MISLTVSPIAKEVVLSLRTRDPQEAKARHSAAAAYIEQVWQGLREGPGRLTQRNVQALAGDIYRAWTEAFEDDPGSPGLWATIRAENENARQGS